MCFFHPPIILTKLNPLNQHLSHLSLKIAENPLEWPLIDVENADESSFFPSKFRQTDLVDVWSPKAWMTTRRFWWPTPSRHAPPWKIRSTFWTWATTSAGAALKRPVESPWTRLWDWTWVSSFSHDGIECSKYSPVSSLNWRLGVFR